MIAGVGLGLCLVEVLLRTAYPVFNSVLVLDERYLYRPAPGARKLFVHGPENGGATCLVEIDEEGFRRAPPGGARSGPRVVVYGDSFIAGEFSPVEETFAERLRAALSASSGPVEVLNAGVVGYGPDQVCLRLEDDLRETRPDLVIVGIYAGNDFGDLVRNKIFALSDDGGLRRRDYRIGRRMRDTFDAARQPAVLRALRRMAWRGAGEDAVEPGSYVDTSLRDCMREHESYLADDEVVSLFDDHHDADLAAEPGHASSRLKVELMARVLGRLSSLCADAGVKLVLVVIPAVIDVSATRSEHVELARRFPAYSPTRLTTSVTSSAVARGIDTIDLFSTFQSAGADGLYFNDPDDHWNGAGQRLAADVVAQAIRASGVLPGAR